MRRFLNCVLLAVLGLIALRQIVMYQPWGWPKEAYRAAAGTIPVWFVVLAWIAILAAIIGMAVHAVARSNSRQTLKLESREGGPLMLRQQVIVKLLYETLSHLPEVDKLRIQARTRGGALNVRIGVRGRGIRSVRELETRMRQLADEALRSVLGIESVEAIQICLEDIATRYRQGGTSNRGKASSALKARAPLESVPAAVSETDLEESEPDPVAPGAPETTPDWPDEEEFNAGAAPDGNAGEMNDENNQRQNNP